MSPDQLSPLWPDLLVAGAAAIFYLGYRIGLYRGKKSLRAMLDRVGSRLGNQL